VSANLFHTDGRKDRQLHVRVSSANMKLIVAFPGTFLKGNMPLPQKPIRLRSHKAEQQLHYME